MTDELARFTAGQAIEVPVKSIETELAALWRKLGPSGRGGAATAAAGSGKAAAAAAGSGEAAATGGGGEAAAGAAADPVVRACLWNVVIRTGGGDAFARAKRLVDDVSPSVPARVQVVEAAAPGDGPIAATIEANWHAGDGGKRQVGSEEITLRGPRGAAADLAAVVRALTAPDVPIAAIWHEVLPAPDDPLDAEMLDGADRVVLAVDGAEEALASMARVLLGSRGIACRGAITALPWLRATPWRQLLASLFDPPVDGGEASSIESVAIACAPDRVVSALLYVGWLASRLGWTAAAREGDGRRYRFTSATGRAVSVTIDAAHKAGADVLQRVSATTQAGQYAITRSDSNVVLETPAIARKQPRHVATAAELCVAALGARGRDPLLLESLRIVAPLAASAPA